MDLTRSMRRYVGLIQELERGEGRATTSRLAGRMGVAAPSATPMLKKLAALGLVEHEPYRGATLTPTGKNVALEALVRRRLLVAFLVEVLGCAEYEADAEARRLEHEVSEGLQNRMRHLLQCPKDGVCDSRVPSEVANAVGKDGLSSAGARADPVESVAGETVGATDRRLGKQKHVGPPSERTPRRRGH